MDIFELLVSLTVVFTALVVYYHIKIFSFWRSRGVPGPTPWPIFGTNIYYILNNKIETDLAWKKKYGRTYGLFEGYSPLLRTHDADVIKQIYIKQSHSYGDRNHRFVHHENQRRWLLWSPSDYWANQRALISPLFSASKLRNVFPVMASCVDRLIEEVKKRNRKNVGNKNVGNTANLATFNKFDLSATTLDVIASCFFGLKLDTYKVTEQPDEFIVSAYNIADFSMPRFLLWLFVPRQVAVYFGFDLIAPRTYQYFDTLSQKIIKERRAQSSANGSKRNDVIQALIDAKLPDKYEQVFTKLDDAEAHYHAEMKHQELEELQQQQTKEAKHFRSFSDIEIRGQMTFFFIAGFETTASTLSFALHEIAHQPVYQEKMLAELRDTFGEKGEKIEQEDAGESYSKLLNLRELDAFVSETLRMYSPLIEHNRMVTDDNGVELKICEKTGKTIKLPKGVAISTNGFVLQRDSDYFDEPDKFDASRFYAENRGKIITGTFMPFGLGPRHCVGMRFALLEVKLAIAKILLKFKVCPNDNYQYPPKFRNNTAFLQFADTTFKLMPRNE